jgi:hypothetical protein
MFPMTDLRQERSFARGRGLAVEQLAGLVAVDGVMVSRAGLRRWTLYLTGGVAKSCYISLGVQRFTVRAKGPSPRRTRVRRAICSLSSMPSGGRLPSLPESEFSRTSSVTAGDGG